MTPSSKGRKGVTRRTFLRAASAAAAATAGGSLSCTSASDEQRDRLVVIFLRGGLDALSLFVPHGDDLYYARRPKLAVPASNVLDFDGYFGLNQAAAPLMPLFQEEKLAVVQAVGHGQVSRSHFQSMRHVEEANPNLGSVGSGWIARHLGATPAKNSSPGRAIALQSTLPPSLQGGPAAIPVPSLANFGFRGGASSARRMDCLRQMYTDAPEPDRGSGAAAIGLVETLGAIDFVNRTPERGAQYPAGKFGRALYESSSLIKSRAPIEVIAMDFGGWDDHRALGAVTGAFATRANELAQGLSAFMTDLGPDASRVTTLVMTEFGRGLHENGSGGTSHGRAGAALLLGGTQVNGGRFYGEWPGLGRNELDMGAVRVTTDIRDVIAEILRKRLHTGCLDAVLPGYLASPLGCLVTT